MSERGAVHLFQAVWTRRLPDGTRVRRKTKVWYWRFCYHGRLYSGGPGKLSKEEARELGERRKREVVAGQEDDWRKLTMQGLYIMAAAYKVTWKPNTVSAFEGCWKRIFRHIPQTTLVQYVDEEALLRFVAARKGDGSTVNSIKLDLHHIRGAMLLAHNRRRLPWVPKFPRLREQRREQTIRPEELEVILNAVPEYWRLYFLAAAEMGWRAASELRTRKWTDVEWGPPGWVVLPEGESKTGQRRVFPMTARLREILDQARFYVEAVQLQNHVVVPWIFCQPNGNQLGDHKDVWERALKVCGFGKIPGRKGPWSNARVVHDLRRTAIRRFERAGLPRSVSQGMVGHGSERTFSAYAGRGADPEALQRAAEILDAEDSRDERVTQLDLFKKG